MPVPWDEKSVEAVLDRVLKDGGVHTGPFNDTFMDALHRYAVEPTTENRARAKKAGLAWVEEWNESVRPLGFQPRQ